LGQSILLADPRFIFRRGLRDFFSRTFRDIFFEEAPTVTAFTIALTARPYDFVVVHQSFLVELAHQVPEGISIILAPQPNKDIFLASYAHHVRAYLTDNPSECQLRFVLHLQVGDFWVDPAFSRWVVEQMSEFEKQSIPVELLTKREQEIVELRTRGLSYAEIAERLCIATSTVKRHIVNIGRRHRKHLRQRLE
jgi:DNA-binding NarL/FixJ family response regulator